MGGEIMEQRECDTVKTVPMFDHENALWHYNMCNKRMLIALCVVCVTFIVTILVFSMAILCARKTGWTP